MKKHLLAVLLLFALVFALVPAVGAQDAGCFNLSAADCAIIQSAASNSDNISSFHMNFTVDLTASGLGVLAMMVGEDIPDSASFRITGSGPFALTPDGASPLGLSLDMTVDTAIGSEVESMSFPFAIIENYIYLPAGDEIVGVALDEENAAALDEAFGGMGLGDLTTDMGGERPATLGDLFASADDPMMDEGLDELAAYIDYQRLPDVVLMGQTLYPFSMTVDVTALLNSPEFTELMGLAGSFAGDDPDAAMMLAMVPMLLSGVESAVVVTQYAGADDNFIHKFTFDFTFAMDMAMLMGSEPGSMDPIDVRLIFDVELDQVNEPQAFTPPAGARILTPEEAEELFSSMDGGF